MKPAHTAGFTLLEALVVLIITSLVSVVLVQGFGLILAARTSVENKLVDLDQTVLQRNVLLEPLRGVIPDYPNRPNAFTGADRRLHGLTNRPLEERNGTPVPFTLSMDYDKSRDQTALTYQEDGAEPEVIDRWSGDKGTFLYRDRSGDWSAIWPMTDQSTQTPWLIRLDTGGEDPTTLIASVAGSHQRLIRPLDAVAGIGGTPPP